MICEDVMVVAAAVKAATAAAKGVATAVFADTS